MMMCHAVACQMLIEPIPGCMCNENINEHQGTTSFFVLTYTMQKHIYSFIQYKYIKRIAAWLTTALLE